MTSSILNIHIYVLQMLGSLTNTNIKHQLEPSGKSFAIVVWSMNNQKYDDLPMGEKRWITIYQHNWWFKKDMDHHVFQCSCHFQILCCYNGLSQVCIHLDLFWRSWPSNPYVETFLRSFLFGLFGSKMGFPTSATETDESENQKPISTQSCSPTPNRHSNSKRWTTVGCSSPTSATWLPKVNMCCCNEESSKWIQIQRPTKYLKINSGTCSSFPKRKFKLCGSWNREIKATQSF